MGSHTLGWCGGVNWVTCVHVLVWLMAQSESTPLLAWPVAVQGVSDQGCMKRLQRRRCCCWRVSVNRSLPGLNSQRGRASTGETSTWWTHTHAHTHDKTHRHSVTCKVKLLSLPLQGEKNRRGYGRDVSDSLCPLPSTSSRCGWKKLRTQSPPVFKSTSKQSTLAAAVSARRFGLGTRG